MTDTRVKMLISYDVVPELQQAYYEFVLSELIHQRTHWASCSARPGTRPMAITPFASTALWHATRRRSIASSPLRLAAVGRQTQTVRHGLPQEDCGLPGRIPVLTRSPDRCSRSARGVLCRAITNLNQGLISEKTVL